MKTDITHRQRMEDCIQGFPVDRSPVSLWRHFPVDDQNPTELARSTILFQQQFDFDFIKVSPASSFCLKDWGAQDAWKGNPEGSREYTKAVIKNPEDWRKLTVLNPQAGYLSLQTQALKTIIKEAGQDTPVIQTIFSPLAQAKNLVGKNQLISQLRSCPDCVLEGLKTITKSTINFIHEIKKLRIDGIFYAVQHAQMDLLSIPEYELFGRQFDQMILNETRDLWLNLLHLHGENVMFKQVADYPVAIINWHDRETSPSLEEAAQMFPGVMCGGLRQWETMVNGNPEEVLIEARQAMTATKNKRFILGTGCVLPISAPRVNIEAARFSVELFH